MMNFNTIKKYSNFQSYQRIKAIKVKQKFDNKGPKPNRIQKEFDTYQDYLDKKDGFKCCCVKTCNGCCNYAPIPSIPNSDSQSYSTTSRDECICFKGLLVPVVIPNTDSPPNYEIGYFPNFPPSSISPNTTCEGLTITTLFADTAGNDIHMILRGDTFGGTIWKCLIITQGNTTIRLLKVLAATSADGEYVWSVANALLSKLTADGKPWCIMLTQ